MLDKIRFDFTIIEIIVYLKLPIISFVKKIFRSMTKFQNFEAIYVWLPNTWFLNNDLPKALKLCGYLLIYTVFTYPVFSGLGGELVPFHARFVEQQHHPVVVAHGQLLIVRRPRGCQDSEGTILLGTRDE